MATSLAGSAIGEALRVLSHASRALALGLSDGVSLDPAPKGDYGSDRDGAFGGESHHQMGQETKLRRDGMFGGEPHPHKGPGQSSRHHIRHGILPPRRIFHASKRVRIRPSAPSRRAWRREAKEDEDGWG